MEIPIPNGEYIGVAEVGGSVGAGVGATDGEQSQLSLVLQLQSQFLLAGHPQSQSLLVEQPQLQLPFPMASMLFEAKALNPPFSIPSLLDSS